ncbi:tRNA 4-thiouridine(8) synthase ThiI [Marispirochaeta aestuarii]|uniref:Probable tRNA sulfurtransferase n=1 Tax=Marispirochaeta aestuarii TaxID=1963862 RepID=A0A1Y1RXD0_9SPIO|nr:tRNA uracil 4-sulfurtransferase ThiI [Marispirochaeta aestuarii]ORC34424.1 tRNA 4-thiouridine(8) synthase ThiI [Marispirochaeta aestuarii]
MNRELTAHYLIRVGEIGLKGNNRRMFEQQLKENIKRRLKGLEARVTGGRGRFFLELFSGNPAVAEEVLASTFGIVAFARVRVSEKDMEAIRATAAELLQKEVRASASGTLSFKINAKRTDKSFPLNSYQIAVELGDRLTRDIPGLTVDVKNPDVSLQIEVRDKVYIWGPQSAGPGGLPVSCAGKGILLLSGGIDSPVAGWMMAKRGLKLDAVYFHAYPYTSDEAKEKVVQLARILAPWNGGMNLFVVPFTKTQLKIKERVPKEAVTLIMRAGMMQVAHMAAEERGAGALVSGEALSQVASQTAGSMRFTGSVTDYPVFRPLIGMDKEEIIRTAERIGTYETSILPYEDCCTIFSPKHPLTSPNFSKILGIYRQAGLENELTEAYEESERIYIPPYPENE